MSVSINEYIQILKNQTNASMNKLIINTIMCACM